MKKMYTYTITMANGEQFPNVRIDRTIGNLLGGITQVFLQIQTESGKTIELSKYQIMKAELTDVEG